MKKVFRNFLISTIIIYFVLSIGVTIFNFIVYYNELSSLDAISNSNIHEETIEIPSNLDISEFFTIEYLHGKSEILYQNLFLILFGSAARTFPSYMSSGSLNIFGIHISYVSLLSLVLTFVCTGLLLLFINHTRLGKAMRAVSEDRGAAELMGINVNTTISVTFAIGSGLGAIAGIIYGMSYSLINPYLGAMLGIKAFIAAVLGGIGSIPGAMVGGLIIGVAEAFTISYISSAFSDAVVFGILIFILLVKPAGIFGKNVREKV